MSREIGKLVQGNQRKWREDPQNSNRAVLHILNYDAWSGQQ